jgi:hypothetical protein
MESSVTYCCAEERIGFSHDTNILALFECHLRTSLGIELVTFWLVA